MDTPIKLLIMEVKLFYVNQLGEVMPICGMTSVLLAAYHILVCRMNIGSGDL